MIRDGDGERVGLLSERGKLKVNAHRENKNLLLTEK